MTLLGHRHLPQRGDSLVRDRPAGGRQPAAQAQRQHGVVGAVRVPHVVRGVAFGARPAPSSGSTSGPAPRGRSRVASPGEGAENEMAGRDPTGLR